MSGAGERSQLARGGPASKGWLKPGVTTTGQECVRGHRPVTRSRSPAATTGPDSGCRPHRCRERSSSEAAPTSASQAPGGSTDQDHICHLTAALPPQYATRLFDAQQASASDQELQEIAAEALREVYFQDGGRRAGSLEEVRFTDVEHLEFEL